MLPILAVVLIPFGLKIFSLLWWQPMIWLHIVVFGPAAAFCGLFLVFGDSENVVAQFIDDVAIFLIAFGTANAGFAVLAIGFLFYTLLWLTKIFKIAYFLLFLIYSGFALYTEWF